MAYRSSVIESEPKEELIMASRLKKLMTYKGKKSSMETFAANDKADYYSGITSITINGKNAYEFIGKFLDDLHNNAFSGTNGKDAKIGGDEIEVSDDESSDLEEYWSDKEETAKNFKIKTDVFYYETPLCLAFNEFNYILKVDLDLLTKDIMGWREDGYCNGSNLPGAYHIGNSLYYQDFQWYETLEDSELKDEALRNKAIMEGLINDDESGNDCWRRWKSYEIYYNNYDEEELLIVVIWIKHMGQQPDLTFLRVFGALCYPTNDSEDLRKLQPTADIGIFVGYAPSRKGYRIYNKRTQRIMKSIHISSWIVPNPVLVAPYVSPTNKELEILFQLMFDEYLEPPRVERPVSPATVVQVLVISAGTPSSTTIDQDAPFTSQSELQHPISHQGVAVGSTIIEENIFAHAGNDPLVNVFAPEPSSEASSSMDVSSVESIYVTQPHHYLGKWNKDHPLENVIGNPSRPVSTRKQLATDALWCLYNSVLS
ncbi:retrovirus-related pol polyprotein from transposon TNT 1-94, partial [Tanacetum coccineum]